MLDYYRIKAPFPNRKAHDEQKFLRFLKKQLKEFSQNTGKQEMIIKKILLAKKVVFFCKNELGLRMMGERPPWPFHRTEDDGEGCTAIGNKNQLR